MSEASHMNVKVEADSVTSTRGKPTRMITLDVVIAWIKTQQLDDYTTKGLIEIASTYPTAGLATFRRNFNLMLQRVRAKRKKEQGGTEYVQEEIVEESVQENVSLDEALSKVEFKKE